MTRRALPHFNTIIRRLVTLALVGVVVAVGGARSTTAQAAPVIQSLNVNAVTDTTASISYSVSPAAGVRIAYGTTNTYGSCAPVGCSLFTGATPSGGITINGLAESTTYHFRLEVDNGAGPIVISSDRTFTTKPTGTPMGTLQITNIVVDCIDVRCSVTFTTSDAANVQMGYDTKKHTDFAGYATANLVSEAPGEYPINHAPFTLTGLSPSKQYFYRMQATGPTASVFTTNDLNFTTSGNAADHTFTTGSCTGGIPIGACSPTGAYCAPGGVLVFDCTSICGYKCPVGQTCTAGGICVEDPALTGSPYQCNKGTCYDANGNLKIPVPAGCYASWTRCNANTILKVRKDRGCNLWLSCAGSIQSPGTANQPPQDLCLNLGACNSINSAGQCTHYLPLGQCDNDPLRFCSSNTDCMAGGTCIISKSVNPTNTGTQESTYKTPGQVDQIADLSGNITVGLDWERLGPDHRIPGNFPWQLMRQYAGDGGLENSDFENHPPDATPWQGYSIPAVPVGGSAAVVRIQFEENQSTNSNKVLFVDPAKDEKGSYLGNSGATSQEFSADKDEYYYAEAQVKSVSGKGWLKMELNNAAGNKTTPAIPMTSAWQHVVIGPVKGLDQETTLRFFCTANPAAKPTDPPDCASFLVDNVQVRPILQVNSNPDFITPSCRLYPKADSPTCDYTDDNGVSYKGWRGYCLEHDSVTGTCLSWWPVDILKGQTNIFASPVKAGYQDRQPLYFCAESVGQFNNPDPATSTPAVPVTAYNRSMIDNTDSGAQTAARFGQPFGLHQVISMYEPSPSEYYYGFTSMSGNECANMWSYCQKGLDRGFCGCGGNNTNGRASPASMMWNRENILNASATDAKLHESDVDAVELYTQISNGNEPYGFDEMINGTSTYQNGCGGAFIGKPWSFCVENGDGGYWTIHLVWDENDHHLKGYQVEGNYVGRTIDQGGLWVQLNFILREKCTKVVQVVTPSGGNKAFANRVNNSSYPVPVLGYKRASDFLPFGAIYPETNSGDPSTWTQPVYAEKPKSSFTYPGQARSGSPYACVGNCSQMPLPNNFICTTDPSNDCATPAKVKECENVSGAPTGTGHLPGTCVGVGSLQASSKGAQTIDTGEGPARLALPKYTAEETIRRLFVKSYGYWELQPTSPTAMGYVENKTVRWNPPTTTCTTCAVQNVLCLPPANPRIHAYGATSSIAALNARNVCAGMTACNGNTATCPIKTGAIANYSFTASKVGPGDCLRTGLVGNLAWRCYATCFVDPGATYNKAVPAPTTQRPATPNDYCAVLPQIACPDQSCSPSTSAKFSNSNAPALVLTSGSGLVSIQFKPIADPDQEPLSKVSVDWGDDAVDTFAYPYASQQIMTFSHVYVANSSVGATYNIKVQVKDNWGWCSDGIDSQPCHANKICLDTGSACEVNADCPGSQCVHTTWRDTGLSVTVQP